MLAHKHLIILLFVAAVLAPVIALQGASAEDPRLEKARRARDEFLEKRGPARGPTPTADEDYDAILAAALEAARDQMAEIDRQIEANRTQAEQLKAPRDKLIARQQELTETMEKLRGGQRERVSAIYRGAKLGAGVAGWHPEPQRSARLSRYLVSVAAVGREKLSQTEVEQGSVMAALDRARAEEAAVLASARVLAVDRIEAEAGLARAMADSGLGPVPPTADQPAAEDFDADLGDAPSQEALADYEGTEDLAALAEFAKAEERAAALAESADAEQEAADLAAEVTADQAADLAAEEAADQAKEAAAALKLAIARKKLEQKLEEEVAAKEREEATSESAREVELALAAAAARGELPGKADEQEVEDTRSDATSSVQKAAGSRSAVVSEPDRQPGEADAAPAQTQGETSGANVEKSKSRRSGGLMSRIFGGDRQSDDFAAARGTMTPPVTGKVVAHYGQRHDNGATYRGAILRARGGAAVVAVSGGRVSFVGNVPGLGNSVAVAHGGRYHTVYSRLGAVSVKVGQEVRKGEKLGSLPPDDADLHLELRDKGNAIDPLPWLGGN